MHWHWCVASVCFRTRLSLIAWALHADPNRNWDDHWCEQGADPDPCSDSYCGTLLPKLCLKAALNFSMRLRVGSKAFSEIEVFSAANYVMNQKNIQGMVC